MNCKDIRPLMMDYLYDEISDEDLLAFNTHLSTCVHCQNEVDALKGTSRILKQWEDVEPDFNIVLVNQKESVLRRLKKKIHVLLPQKRKLAVSFGYAFAAIFLLMAIGNTEISYQDGNFNMKVSLFQRQNQSQSEQNLFSQQMIEKLQQDNYYLMQTLIQQSETRQRKELATNLVQLKQELDRQRSEDLNLVGYGLNNIERRTTNQLQRTDNSLNELIRAINSQGK